MSTKAKQVAIARLNIIKESLYEHIATLEKTHDDLSRATTEEYGVLDKEWCPDITELRDELGNVIWLIRQVAEGMADEKTPPRIKK